MEEIRTGLENQERKIVRCLLKNSSPRITLETCLDLDLRLNPDKVKREMRVYEKRKNNLRKTLAAIIMASSLSLGGNLSTSMQTPVNVQEIEVEIPSGYIEENDYRFADYIEDSIDKEYSDEEIREKIIDYIENLRQ